MTTMMTIAVNISGDFIYLINISIFLLFIPGLDKYDAYVLWIILR